MNIRNVTTAAVAVVNYDLIKDEINAQLPESRVLVGLMFTGSTAAGDCIIEVMIGNKSVGKFENTSTGLAADRSTDWKGIDEFIPAGTRVQAFVRDAAATNPVVLTMEFAKPKRRTGRLMRRQSSPRRISRRPAVRQGMY